MAVVELRDRDAIAAVLRGNAPAHVYELGDLDDFDWPYTRWLGGGGGDRLERVALLYPQRGVPVLIAIAEEPAASMSELVGETLPALPSPLYVHVPPPLL